MNPSCLHPHFQFDQMGQKLRCSDCGRHWFPLVHDPKKPLLFIFDFGHFNAALGNQLRSDPKSSKSP